MKFLNYSPDKLKLINIVFLLALLTTVGKANAKLRDLETTRLMSTSGAGIGSILLNEAAFLNPASIYFFQDSTFYYQKGNSRMDNQSGERADDYKDGDNEVFLLTDTNSALKGGFSYQTQSENGDTRKRLTSSASNNLGKKASFGALYRYTEDDAEKHHVYHQAIFGLTYVHNKRLVLGAILADPFLANRDDTRLATGIQYTLTENFLFIGDAGTNYSDEPEENRFWKAAFQAQFFENFFLRYGRFEDHIENLRGNSWGVSWIGPRLSAEYAFKKSKVFQDNDFFFKGEELEDHSFAISVVF